MSGRRIARCGRFELAHSDFDGYQFVTYDQNGFLLGEYTHVDLGDLAAIGRAAELELDPGAPPHFDDSDPEPFYDESGVG